MRNASGISQGNFSDEKLFSIKKFRGRASVTVLAKAKVVSTKSHRQCDTIHLHYYAGLAQLFRARPCQGRGRELESLNPHQ